MSYQQFLASHQSGLLILPNAWDAGSAHLLQEAGARAIATTSAGVAFSHGWPDGNQLPAPQLIATVAEIARVVRVPLTIDVEGGYSNDANQVAALVLRVIQAGAVGINLEDGAASVENTRAKVVAIRAALHDAKLDAFINLRTDVYLRKLAPPEQRVEETLRRAAAYRHAGASGLFVPGVAAPDEIEALAGQALPLNVMAVADLPAAQELQALGVRRLSAGAALWSVAMAHAQNSARDFLATGDSAAMFAAPQINFGHTNAKLAEQLAADARA